jgi:hypothetical protein
MRKSKTERPTLATATWTPVADNQILLALLELCNEYERRLATIQRTARGLSVRTRLLRRSGKRRHSGVQLAEASRHRRASLLDQLLAVMDAVATAKISHDGSAL